MKRPWSVYKSVNKPYTRYYFKFIFSWKEEHYWYFGGISETVVGTASKLSKTMLFGIRNCSLGSNLLKR